MIIVEESCHELAIEDHLTLFNHMAIDKHYRSSSRRGSEEWIRDRHDSLLINLRLNRFTHFSDILFTKISVT